MDIRGTMTAVAASATLLAGLLAGCSALPGGGSGDTTTGGRGEPVVNITAKPVAGGTFPAPVTDGGGQVEIAIMGLNVHGKLATLTTRMTPRLPAGSEPETNIWALNGNNYLYPSLIDPVNLKRYVVVQDSGNDWLQTNEYGTELRNNQPRAMTFTFAAPPESVKTVDVQLGSWPTFRNVPVQR